MTHGRADHEINMTISAMPPAPLVAVFNDRNNNEPSCSINALAVVHITIDANKESTFIITWIDANGSNRTSSFATKNRARSEAAIASFTERVNEAREKWHTRW